ncbi:MAG: DUF4360 domain-containing protein [Myxococcota bacterium]
MRTILLSLLVTSACLALGPVTITSPVAVGDCAADDIRVVEEAGEYYIAAYFQNMDAIAETKVLDKKRCTMNYKIQLAPDYKLDVFQFSVDGVYQLSEHGTARLTVSHRVVNNSSARTTKFFSASQGDAAMGDIHDYSGAISADQIPASYSHCGASIPLTTSIYAEAVKPAADQTGLTRISLDEGVSSHYTKLCKIVVDPCQR